jgi:hypothetical protein
MEEKMFEFGTVAFVVVALIIAWAISSIFLAMIFRIVVATNEVHIVQSRRKTT